MLVIILWVAIGVVIVITIILSIERSREKGTQCLSDNDCASVAGKCVDGYCQAKACTKTRDCTGNQVCYLGFCQPKTCRTWTDCAATEGCVNGTCTPIGGACTTSDDCFDSTLQCISSKCVQCGTSADCDTGQLCSNGICRTCQSNASVCAQNNTCCPTDQTCVSDTVCCGGGEPCGTPCTTTAQCSGTCPNCVKSVCTCATGQLFDPCTQDSDCASENCVKGTGMGDICGYKTKDCLFNNTQGESVAACGADTPFCVQGSCSAVQIGAYCKGQNLSDGLNSLCASTIVNGQPSAGGVSFCVNDFCRGGPGILNENCNVDNDCTSGLQCQSGVCSPNS